MKLILAALLGCQASASVAGSALSPVTRVVELLKGISADVEKEAKVEEDLYETFACWAKSMISQKTKSNAAAEARSTELRTYIDDLDNGRIELTTERADLTKEVEELSTDIETATQMRSKENKDFEDASDEMQKAIAALDGAVAVLKTATEDHKHGVLLAGAARHMEAGFEARQEQAAALSLAATLGGRVLAKADASFLRRLLTGEVPKADWKKLNRKATFKMDYKARSFKIQGVVAKLLEDFRTDLAEANEKEAEAVRLYDTLMESKNREKSTAQEALSNMEKENGARGLSREESAAELDSLTEQIENDEKYINQVQTSYDDKKLEWKDRKELRAGELAAISKAINILHNDDSRDLFKKSFASQDKSASLLQVAASSRGSRAAAVLRGAAAAGRGDARLTALARRAASAGHFDEVVVAIDKMLEHLQKEENSDLAKKEQCESNRAEDTRQAIVTSRNMDELSDAITAGEAKIEELTQDIKGKTQDIADLREELKQALEMREQENAEWKVSDKEDADAKVLVVRAKDVLASFYSDNSLMLAQQASRRQPFESVAGDAPPPPPPTWEAPYGGKTDEQQGIQSILEMVASDIQKDLEKSKREEDASEALYQESKLAMETQVQNLQGAIVELDAARADTEQAVEDDKADRLGHGNSLGALMAQIKDSEPGCDYFNINYPLRVRNRQVETDGLNKAKTILSGGAFAAPEDPGREMRPGDALLQRRSKFLGHSTVL